MSDIIAIDPGTTGAIAYLYGSTIQVYDMPAVTITTGKKKRSEIDPLGLCALIRGLIENGPCRVVCERVHAMPLNGSVANFAQGFSMGVIKTTMLTLGVSAEYITPQSWKKVMRCGSDKEKARQLAIDLYPDLYPDLKLKKHHNRAEAVLMAEYMRRQNQPKAPARKRLR